MSLPAILCKGKRFRRIVISLLVPLGYQLAPAQGYFPLQPGNVWHYYVPGAPHDTLYAYSEEAIGDTLMPNGFTYMKISRTSYGSTTKYLRQSGTQVFECITRPDSPQVANDRLKYDFSKADGDTVAVYIVPGDTIITTVLEVKNEIVLGRLLKHWIFNEESVVSPFLSVHDVCDSLGLAHLLYEPGEEYLLLGAMIDGKAYGTLTSVATQNVSNRSIDMSFSNYPNPFNGETRLSINNATAQKLVVTLYDILGRKVIELFNDRLPPGVHTLSWNGLNESGSPVASGVYFCSMRMQSAVLTQRLILVR